MAESNNKTSRRFRSYPAYKDSGVEWLGDVPGHWSIFRLCNTVTDCRNGIWGDEPSTGSADIACIRVADFDRVKGRVVDRELTVRAVAAKQRTGKVLHRGDLLIEKSGGGEQQLVGAVVLFDLDGDAVCSNFVARMPVATGFAPAFLCYLHASLYAGRLNLRSIKQSIGIQNLDSASYLSELAGFPSLDEQSVIAAFLDRETARIDELVAKKERLIGLLLEKRAALITRAVTKGLDPNVQMKDSGVEWLGEIPSHWELCQLRRVIRKFVDYRGKTPEKVPTGIPLVTARNIKFQKIDFNSSEAFIAEEEYEKWMVRGFPEIGDVLVTTEAPLGESAQIYDINVALAQRIILLKANKTKILNEYLKYHFSSDSGLLELYSRATGSTALGIKASHFKSTFVLVPPYREQEQICSHIDVEIGRFDRMISKVREAIYRLKEYRIALISAAVTGKIDVREEVSH
jgi:type I restriction enzyme S subunit